MSMRVNNKKGFTLIEILVVVALIAILATITFIAINPSKNFADTRNAQRSSDVTQILNAVTQYTSEQGNSLSDLGTVPTCGGAGAPASIGTSGVDLAADLVDEYIVGIPEDPQSGTPEVTGYSICQTTGGRVEITSDFEENGKEISVRR